MKINFLSYLIAQIITCISCILLSPPNFNLNIFHWQVMNKCLKIVDCNGMKHLELAEELHAEGAVKRRFLVHTDNTDAVYCYPRNENVYDDFVNGMKMLLYFQSTGWVVDVMAYCLLEPQMLLKYHKLGSADRLDNVLMAQNLDVISEFKIRLQMSLDYLSIMEMLHHHDLDGPYVMCDTNTLEKTLQQFLLTSNLRLIALDLDALPKVDKKNLQTIKCGHRELKGNFVAPEQLWPFNDTQFEDEHMPGYDEKTDIWKIPDVLVYFLGKSHRSLRLQLSMHEIFQRCKSIDSKKRPDIRDIRSTFLNLVRLKFKTEL